VFYPRVELNLDDVLDDLVRQVTSDPFLNSERRRQLQADIYRVREEARAKHLKTPEEEREVADIGQFRSSLTSTLVATVAA
jgi:hypothetical protein